MFIRHLIGVDAVDLFANAITLRIDLGVQATLTSDLQDYVVQEIVDQLCRDYQVDVHEANFVRAAYRSELARFRKSIYGGLLESDPAKFKEKELECLEARLQDRANHCRRSLEHISKARKKQIVVFIDNADQRGDATQDTAFLIAQELAARWPVLVYIALRPETFHRSVSEGALSGYHAKAFTVAPPRIDRVLAKRLA